MWTGSLDKTGSPTLEISIFGVNPDFAQKFDAVIDTGFSGFISMPILKAFPLGLILHGTTTVVLADGSTRPKLTAIGTAIKENEEQTAVIILDESSNDVLIGMDFLKKFQKVLMLHPHKPFVVLEDCATVDKIIEAFAEAAEKKASEQLALAVPPGQQASESQAGDKEASPPKTNMLDDKS